MTYDEMMAVMVREDDERCERARKWLLDPSNKYPTWYDRGLSINAGRAEQLMREAGHSYRSGRVKSGAACRVWALDDREVYVLIHIEGHPCMFKPASELRDPINFDAAA